MTWWGRLLAGLAGGFAKLMEMLFYRQAKEAGTNEAALTAREKEVELARRRADVEARNSDLSRNDVQRRLRTKSRDDGRG